MPYQDLAVGGSTRPEQTIRQAEAASSGSTGHLRFPNKPFPHSIMFVFKEYSYDGFQSNSFQNLLSAGTRNLGQTLRTSAASVRSSNAIELPFPKQLQDNTTLEYNGFSRDPLIEGLANQISNFAQGRTSTIGDIPGMIQGAGADLARALTSSSTGAFGRAINDIAAGIAGTSNYDAASIAQYLLRSARVLPDQISKSINTATGQVINPRETLAFEGVQLRTHQFTWDLMPSNEEDSQRIMDIIRQFKLSVLPVTQNLGTGSLAIEKAFLRYPKVCYTYLIGVNENAYMKFKPSMVRNFSVDYAGGGTMAIMKGGKPAGVTLSLQMQELQIETAEDYGASPAAAQAAPRLPQTTVADAETTSTNSGGPGFRAGQ